jgi:uncharacterized membrane protein YdbT with pleckstrin-like domain
MRTTLKKEERILLIIRQHWIKLAIPVLSWILLVVILILLQVTGFFTGFLIALVAALYPAYEIMNWRYNLWAVTNMRVVDESGYFSRYSKESPLDKINNVEYDQTFFGRLFGYGNVDIQTAAELGETTYQMIHHPGLLKDTITHAQEDYKKAQVSAQASMLAEAIARSGSTGPEKQVMVADELHKLFDLLQKGAITQEEYIQQKNKLLKN